MAAVSLFDSDFVRVVESIEQMTLTPESGVNVARGDVVKIGTNGGWALSTAGDDAYGIAVGTTGYGMGITAIRQGVLDGFDLSALAYGAVVGVAGTAGKLDTVPAAGDEVGSVTVGTANTLGSARSKLLHVDCGTA